MNAAMRPMERPRQLPLDLGYGTGYSREDLIDMHVEWISEARKKILVGSPVLGACFLALIWATVMGFAGLVMGLMYGGLFGFIAVIPLRLICDGRMWFYRQRAEQLEYEVWQMERG